MPPAPVIGVVRLGRVRGDNFVSNCQFGSWLSNSALPAQSLVELETTTTTTSTEYPGSQLVVSGNRAIGVTPINYVVSVAMSATSSAPSSLVDNLFVYDNEFVARQLVVLSNAQTLNSVKQIALKDNVFTFVSLASAN